MTYKDLSPKQKEVFNFIKGYFAKHDQSPNFLEIANAIKVKAKSTVDHHLSALEKKGYIRRITGAFRNIVINEAEQGTILVPLLGKVAAGYPIEPVENREFYNVPKRIIPKYNRDYFALEVKGKSMIEDGIYDGEVIIAEKRNYADNGDLIIAKDEKGNATLKYFYREKNQIRLEPRNKAFKPIFLDSCEIVGIMRGLTSKEAIEEVGGA